MSSACDSSGETGFLGVFWSGEKMIAGPFIQPNYQPANNFSCEPRRFDKPLIETRPMNRKEKRAAKKARHKANELRRSVRRVQKRVPGVFFVKQAAE